MFYLNFTQAACLAAMFVLLGWMLSPEVKLHRSEKWYLALMAVGVLVLVLSAWLWAIRASQLAPHKITNSINGRVLSSYWVTNPAHVVWEAGGVPGSPFGEAHPVTNYYWNVWPMFKK